MSPVLGSRHGPGYGGWSYASEAERESFRDWMRDQGMDPNVTRWLEMSGEMRVVAAECVLNEHGHKQLTEDRSDVLTERVEYVVLTPPPWWRGAKP